MGNVINLTELERKLAIKSSGLISYPARPKQKRFLDYASCDVPVKPEQIDPQYEFVLQF